VEIEIKRMAQLMFDSGVIKIDLDNPVTHASGLKAPIYFDADRIQSQVGLREVVVQALVSVISKKCKLKMHTETFAIAGVQTSIISLSTIVAYKLGLPHFVVRKEQKSERPHTWVDGGDPSGMSVILLEDVINSGNSISTTYSCLRNSGVNVVHCGGIFSYGRKKFLLEDSMNYLELCALICLHDFAGFFQKSDEVCEATWDEVITWSNDPTDWSRKFDERSRNF
jgi:orotate phosphoribosyltransferase